MQNYKKLLENANIEIVNKNVLNIVKYENLTDTKKEGKFSEYAFDVCYYASLVFQVYENVRLYKGKNKKAFKIAQLEKYGIAESFSKLGKNDITALRQIGAKAEEYFNTYQSAETKAKTYRGFANLIKADKVEKTLQEKIESFIKSNTTKKADDGKMTIAEFTKEFSIVAQKMLKAQNSEIVDFLPKADDIAVNQ